MAKLKIKKGVIQSMGGLVVGGVIASKVSTIQLPAAVPPMLKTALPVIAGFFLLSKPGIVGYIGAGMVAVGSIKLIGAIAPKLGIGADEEDVNDYQIEGVDYALNGASMEGVDYALNGTSYALSGVDQNDNANFG